MKFAKNLQIGSPEENLTLVLNFSIVQDLIVILLPDSLDD
jgi:hypothetical protein